MKLKYLLLVIFTTTVLLGNEVDIANKNKFKFVYKQIKDILVTTAQNTQNGFINVSDEIKRLWNKKLKEKRITKDDYIIQYKLH